LTDSNRKSTLGEHKELIERYLPASQTDEKALQLKELMNTATRAGAGGTKVGSVGIRPQGLKKANDIVDYLTPGKFEKRKGNFTQEIDFDGAKKQAVPHQIIIKLPRNFCPDCDRQDRPHEGGALNMSTYNEDRPDLGLKAGELLASSFCQECLSKYQAQCNDPAQKLLLPSLQGTKSQKQRVDAERMVRVKKNTENYIRVMRLTSHWEIYTDGRTD